ncbi:translocation/assembly module TamB domain-containing protein [Lacihabitans sp. LS3-19]|uniref:translocation/assembly module TamB domain-containing protein n=1 Tax=Lacihabitans sp. LS3-19 TaxID=2487335 RepID=UPI0020CDCD95|nr:translocation/assembly module TamB domain-containing protein [Lacihabitans sp. LS3-19]
MLVISVGLVLYLNSKPGQKKLSDFVLTTLSDQLKTEVAGSISYGFPDWVLIENLLLKDQKKDTLLAAKSLKLDMDMWALLNNKLTVNNLKVENADINVYYQEKAFNYQFAIDAFSSPSAPKDTTSTPLSFQLDNMDLKSINLKYADKRVGHAIQAKIGKFNSGFKTFNPSEDLYDFKKLDLADISIFGKIGKGSTDTSETNSVLPSVKFNDLDISNLNWDLNFDGNQTSGENIDLKLTMEDLNLPKGEFYLQNIQTKAKNFTYQKANSAKTPEHQINFENIGINDLVLNAKDIKYADGGFSMILQNLQAKEQSGFEIKKIYTLATFKDNRLELSELNIKTNNSEIMSKLAVEVNSKDLGKSTYDFNLTSGNFSPSDALFFDASLKQNEYFKNLANKPLKLSGRFQGDADKVIIENMNLVALQNSNLQVSGSVKRFSEPIFDLNIQKLSSSKKEILSIVPAEQFPEAINIPENFIASGTIKGSLADFDTQLNLSSEQGKASLVSNIKNLNSNFAYSGKLNVLGYDLGVLIKNLSIGKVSSALSFNGSSTDLKSMKMSLNGTVSEAYYEGKKYENISFDGNLKNQIFDTKLAIDDPSAKLSWEGKIDLSKENLQIDGDSKINFVNLKSLGLSTEDITIKGDIALNNFVLDPKSPVIDFEGKNVEFTIDGNNYPIGELKVKTSTQAEIKKVQVNSDFLNASIEGKFDYDQLQNILLAEINNYFKLLDYKPVIQKESYSFKLNGNISYDSVFTAFLPAIKSFENINIDASLQSAGDIPISGNINVPFLQYDSIKVYNTTLSYNGNRQVFTYDLKSDRVSNPSFRLRNASLDGKLENNVGSFNLAVKDSLDKTIHALAGFVQSVDNQLQISFNDDGTMLYYEPWSGNPYGSITYSNKGILINDVIFTSKSQILRVNSLDETPNGPLSVFSKNIDLNFLSQAFLQDSSFVAGFADLDLEVLNYMSDAPAFTGDFLIRDFEFNQVKLGKLDGKAQSNSLDDIKINASLIGASTDVSLVGVFYPKKEEALDFKAKIKKIDLLVAQSYVKDILADLKGNLSGDFDITGSSSSPIISGEAIFQKFDFKLVETGAKLILDNQKLIFRDQKVILNKTEIKDENGKVMLVDGKVDLKNLPNYSYDFKINSEDFKLVNAKKGQNELFYGEGYFGADLSLKGENLEFKLTGDVFVKDNSDLTLLLPDDASAANEMANVVKFVNINKSETKKESESSNALSFANAVNINVDVPEKATLKILMDAVTGDLMTVNGKGKLNVGFDNKGDLFMIGQYDIESGSYELTYQTIKRLFKINSSSESHIVWSGDPMEAELDITAEYNIGKKAISTYPFDNKTILDKYKEIKLNVPLRVDLRVTEVLSAPIVKFELVLKESDIGQYKDDYASEGFKIIGENGKKIENDVAYKKYQDKINSNAIMVLVGGGFNSSEIVGNITNYENLARQKVSDLISSQLDKYASGIIKGIDLNLGLESNSINDTRNTNLNFGVSKKLANDRLSISVGKNFELENKDLKSDEIFDNIQANWLITKDGRYRLKVFRKNLNQMVIEGSVIETGLGFIIAIDYDTWKELMKKK